MDEPIRAVEHPFGLVLENLILGALITQRKAELYRKYLRAPPRVSCSNTSVVSVGGGHFPTIEANSPSAMSLRT
jgi:hypothetical protein